MESRVYKPSIEDYKMASQTQAVSNGESMKQETKAECGGELSANVYQIAILNKLLPRGYKFDLYESVRKTDSFDRKPPRPKKSVIPPPPSI